MNKSNTNIIILVIIVVGVIITSEVSYREFLYPGTCQGFSFVPTCYLGLFYFVVLLFSFLFKNDYIFIFFSGFAFVLALSASLGHLFKITKCIYLYSFPVPACYLALIMFASIVLLKFHLLKNKN